MEYLSSRTSTITPSLTLSIDSRAKQLKAEGHDVCGFGAGEPDYDTPQHIKDAAIQALNEGKTKYTPSSGIPALREAIATKLLEENNIDVGPSQVIVSSGAKQSCLNAILACVGEGDEVLIPAPYWLSYPEMVRIAGGIPTPIQTRQEDDWKITPELFEENMSPRTKMIIINSPGNPTGSVYTAAELQALVAVAAEEEILILSDEIYEKLVYDEAEHISVASLNADAANLTITVNGFSKAYAMTGWRLGYLAAPEPIAKAIDSLQSHMTSNPTSFAQYGGIAALTGDQQAMVDMREEYNVRRQYMLQRLRSIPRLTVSEPKGAFYTLPNIKDFGLSSTNFADKLLSKENVAVVPGIAFGDDRTIRLSYAVGLDVIKEGLDRIERFCQTL
ncbi:MAG: pyridoxal phosphate-dependent aminotransferase [Verrucomicrobiales bacterium]